MIILDHKQGTEEWLMARLGRITGTKVKDAVGSSNLKLIDAMLAEKLTDEGKTFRITAEMQRGSDLEEEARKAYVEQTGVGVQELGLCVHDEYDWLAHSPDGFTKDLKGGIEIKCPNSSKHVEYIRINRIPSEYKYQVINAFIVNQDLEWLDFVSYDPRVQLKPLHIHRVTREELADEIESTLQSLIKFNDKFNKYFNDLFF